MEENYFEYKDNFSKYKDVKSILLYGNKENIPSPKITIAIPTYKRPHLIKDALESAINQINYDNYEIIVVDNDDTKDENETEQLIKGYQNPKILYYKNEKNIGMFGNWNRCIELARGEYISILNDDDWLEKEFLCETIKYISHDKAILTLTKLNDFRKFKNTSENNFTYIFLRKIYNFFRKRKKYRELKLIDFFYSNRSAGTLGTLLKRDYSINLGGYNESFFPISDYVFHTNYCYKYGALLINKELCNYRIQENESLKAASSFPENDYKFRSFLTNFIKNKKKYDRLNYIITENQKKKINITWGTNIPYNPAIVKKYYFLMLLFREINKSIW